jgi:CDP-paratose 2-epimerase
VSVAVVTGSGGLIGAQAAKLFAERGVDVVGIDNDLRRQFFGAEASTAWQSGLLQRSIPNYTHSDTDIRDGAAIEAIFSRYGKDIGAVIHCAAQPSHDWAARAPVVDFTVNANGTLNLLEATRKHCPEAAFIFVSTNKVYGDRPNQLPLIELETRYELAPDNPSATEGFDESMSIDATLHSLFGASKTAADVLTQEYGRYFGMMTACFRAGCLTGSGHSAAQLHGFLAYLIKCAVAGEPYTVFGYKGKQVRDNLHSADLAEAFWCFFQRPAPGQVFNIGGGRRANCSMMEAITLAEELTGNPLAHSYDEANRIGDHIWWISDTRKFRSQYPEWQQRYNLRAIFEDIIAGAGDRWSRAAS